MSSEEPTRIATQSPADANLPVFRQVPFGRGWTWISEGYDIVKLGFGTWIGMIATYFLIVLLVSFIPLLNLILFMAGPVFSAGFMVAAHKAKQDGKVSFADMFAGFQTRTVPLVLLSLVYVGCYIGLMVVMVVLMYALGGPELMSVFNGTDATPVAGPEIGLRMLIVLLVVLALTVPLAMATWFAPALVILRNLGPWQAFSLSFRACLANIGPFLWYGIILALLGFAATLPFALGWLILAPVLVASMYAGYADIFSQAEPPSSPHGITPV